ncbi:MAG: hypothetical protein MPI93_07490, partial [Nitrosopumilus sp.]|nr:hypothetical protein [Nitrosopumilus sp.]
MAGELGAGGGTGQVVARGPDGGESEEMVVLGVAPPDPGEHRNAVCLVAYSEGRGLVRIYPVPTRTRVSRWDVISVCLEKNPDDPRPESMRIRGSGSEWRALHKRIRYAGRLGKEARTKLLGELVGKFCYGCAGDMDGGRASLGMVRPDVIEGFFADRDDPE